MLRRWNQMKINWTIRFKNKTWLAGFISQTVIVLQAIVVALSGFDVLPFNIEQFNGWTATVLIAVNAVLVYFSYLGIIVDPTTQSLDDSNRAMERDKPL